MIRIWLLLFLTLVTFQRPAASNDLPILGDSTSGIISLEQERQLGQQFLRSLRAGAPTLDDPILQDYIEHLVYRLASYSQLKDRRLDIVLINNATLNAFAAPGGIIGVHAGLFNHAQTEQEISAIMAHEIAHLSQRHFARRLAEGRKNQAFNIAGLLAGLVLAATAGTDAGLAAMTSSQALGQNQILSYSREREAEADRVGIDTLVEADKDPRAMAYMFERLQQASRYSTRDRVPEFLRTHPVTSDRIADAYNQTRNFPRRNFPENLDYQLMRARAKALTTRVPAEEVARFSESLKTGSEIQRTASRYGLAILQTKQLNFDAARRNLQVLRDQHPLNIPIRIAEALVYREAGQHDQALALLREALAVSPSNYPLSVSLAETLLSARNPERSLDVLIPLSVDRPNDEYLWYLLAEAYGLANDIPGVHEARAEFFVLNGNFDQAIKQLGYALPLVRQNFQQTARIKQRLEDIWQMKEGT